MGYTTVKWLENELNAIRLDIDKNVLKFIDKSFEQAKELENKQQGYSEEEVLKIIEFVKHLKYMNGTKPQHEFLPIEILEQFKKK